MSEADEDEFGTMHDDPAKCPMWYDWCRCTPSNVLIRAREIHAKKRQAYEAYEAAVDLHWNQNTERSNAQKSLAKVEWNDRFEEWRQFLIAMNASNMDELEKRAADALAGRIPEPTP